MYFKQPLSAYTKLQQTNITLQASIFLDKNKYVSFHLPLE